MATGKRAQKVNHPCSSASHIGSVNRYRNHAVGPLHYCADQQHGFYTDAWPISPILDAPSTSTYSDFKYSTISLISRSVNPRSRNVL
jgi:hypothetical protein